MKDTTQTKNTQLSVIVPVYNVEAYLSRCVDSILSQTFTDFELWLVDDGSPDACPQMCDAYAKQDSRVRVIHKQNGGLSDARNAALDKISMPYVTFVDSDDWIPKDAFEVLYGAIKRTGARMSIGNLVAVGEDGSKNTCYAPANKETVISGDALLSTMRQPCAQNRIYDSELFAHTRYPKGKLYEDVFTYHKILDQLDCAVLAGKETYFYLIRKGSIMHMEYSVRFTDIIDAVQSRLKWLESKGHTKFANETRQFLYSQSAVANARLNRNDSAEKARLREVMEIYKQVFPKLMADTGISAKNKLAMRTLRYAPRIHARLIGRKLPINLG